MEMRRRSRTGLIGLGLMAATMALAACQPAPAAPAAPPTTSTAPAEQPAAPVDTSTTTTSTSSTTSTTSSTSTTTTTALPAPGPTELRMLSDRGDYIGQGTTKILTPANATFTVTGGGSKVSVVVDGGSGNKWTLNFASPIGAQIRPGAFDGATRHPFESPTAPGLSVTGAGRGCNTLTGRFDVLEASTDRVGRVTRFAAEFEQHCEGATAALRGLIRYDVGTVSPDPTDSDGDGLADQVDNCRTVANPTQSDADGNHVGDDCDSGTYLRFESDKGDYIGQSLTRTWTTADGTFTPSRPSNDMNNVQFKVDAGSDANWTLQFRSPTGVITPGTYSDATRFPFQSPTAAGLTVSGSGRACNTSNGTFTVIEAVYDGPTIVRFSANFEQHCEGKAAALRGSIRYAATPV